MRNFRLSVSSTLVVLFFFSCSNPQDIQKKNPNGKTSQQNKVPPSPSPSPMPTSTPVPIKRIMMDFTKAIRCDHMGMVRYFGNLYSGYNHYGKITDTSDSPIYLMAPSVLFFGENPSKEHVKKIYEKSLDLGLTMLLCDKFQFNWDRDADLILSEDLNRKKGSWSHLKIQPTDEQESMMQKIKSLEAEFAGLNEFDKRRRNDLPETIEKLEKELQQSIDKSVSGMRREVESSLYYAVYNLEIKDSDYNFDKKVFSLFLPRTIPPLLPENLDLMEPFNKHPKGIRYGCQVFDFSPIGLTFRQSFGYNQGNGPDPIYLNINPEKTSLLLDGKKTNTISMRIYYTSVFTGMTGRWGHEKMRMSAGSILGYAYYTMLPIHRLELFHLNDEANPIFTLDKSF